MPAAKPSSPILRRGWPLAQGLVLGWPLSEGSGTSTADLSGQDCTGSLNSGATWTQGQSGWCLNFNGTSGFVDTARVPVAATPLTLACWASTSDVTADRTALSIGKAGAADSWLRLMIHSAGTWRANYGDSSGTQANVDGAAATANLWTHLAVTIVPNGTTPTFTFFVNAVSQGSDTAVAAPNAFTKAALGVLHFSSDIQFWSGLLDGAAIWSRALSGDEIAAVYEDSWQQYRRRSWRLKLAAAAGAFVPYNPWLQMAPIMAQ